MLQSCQQSEKRRMEEIAQAFDRFQFTTDFARSEQGRKVWSPRELELLCPKKSPAEKKGKDIVEEDEFDLFQYLKSTKKSGQMRRPSSTREWESVGPLARRTSSAKIDEVESRRRRPSVARESESAESQSKRRPSDKKEGLVRHKRMPSSTRPWETAETNVTQLVRRPSARDHDLPVVARKRQPSSTRGWETIETSQPLPPMRRSSAKDEESNGRKSRLRDRLATPWTSKRFRAQSVDV
jgi:hypothetical protein